MRLSSMWGCFCGYDKGREHVGYIDIIWPTCSDHLSKVVEEWIILDESLELSFYVGCDVHMVDGDV